ncbi:hypothetical protein PIB30_097291 [Stylosanthes scabra]|uniref:Uncharacterized protein n=1 Tax=Stylosanthes scabra TaxID=79078 RepID=A0ABU6TXS1_9FABA|nr:hypothetical protein [Stylosanthes scabra]
MNLYVEVEMGENLMHTSLVGRTVNTQSSQASAQRSSDNSSPNSVMNPPDQRNPLMKDILGDISDHEDEFLYDEEEDEEVEPDEPFQAMHNVGDVAGFRVKSRPKVANKRAIEQGVARLLN